MHAKIGKRNGRPAYRTPSRWLVPFARKKGIQPRLNKHGRVVSYALLASAILLAVSVVLFFVGARGTTAPGDERMETGESAGSIRFDASSWVKYESEKYGFSIEHPPRWEVFVSEDEFTPAINIFDPATVVGVTPPFTHFSDVTHVSLYPHGIPTEGVLSNTRESAVRFGESTRAVNDFLLEDGSVWATAASFRSAPSDSWDEAGFVFANVGVDNLDITCSRGTETVPIDVCDLLSGDSLVRRGTVDVETRAIEERMLASFRFLNSHAGGSVSTSPQVVDLSDLIRVTAPEPGDLITSPLAIRGEARGSWYFEATFPVVLVDWDGRIIAEHYAQAQREWTTPDFVPFEAELTFSAPADAASDRGTLILRKDNPSGLSEHDAAVEIPIRFLP